MKINYILLFTLFVSLLTKLDAQIINSTLYDLRDGTMIAAGQSPDGKIKFGGTYSHHGTTYGLNMKVNGTISIEVDGSSTVRFLGSQYSSLNLEGTALLPADLGVQNTKVANDLSDVFDFTYSGGAKTLTFKLIPGSGNDLYLPTIEVIPSQNGSAVSTPEKNIVYYFDLRDGSIIPNGTDGKSDLTLGLFEVIVGNSNAYGYNGTQHGSVLKGGNKINLKVAGNSYIKVGGSIYSNGNITISSTTGVFDAISKASVTTGNYGQDGSTVDFLYIGDAGTITMDFTGTNYIPYMEIVPVPYPVTLTQWEQKAGTITINGVEIGISSGADASSNATVTVSQGTVISATNEIASVLIDLGGKNLSDYTPTLTGAIDSVEIVSDSLVIHFSNGNTDPKGYIVRISDNSVKVMAEVGKTYMYNFANGSEMPQTSYQALRYATYVSKDGILTIKSNTETAAGQFGYHDAAHGGVFFPGNSFKVAVAGDAIVTFFVDTYGVAADGVFQYSDANGTVLGSTAAVNLGGVDGLPVNFSYTGEAGEITATLQSTNFPTAEVYLHGLNIENAPKKEKSNGKIDVWDFGAAQLDTAIYNNILSVEAINAWYDASITPGSTGKVLPNFNAGILSWTGGTNDRLRTTNTAITRYDTNIANSTEFTGRIYVNAGANVSRFLSLTLDADDEVILNAKTDAGGIINFQYVADPEGQTDVFPISSDFIELKLVAKEAGTYRIFDTSGKPSYFRVKKKAARYVDVTGKVDLTDAHNIPEGYSIVYTNEAGKVWNATVTDSTYKISIPGGYNYNLSLGNANGYIISSESTISIPETDTIFDIAIKRVELNTVSGSIIGIGNDINKLILTYIPDQNSSKIFIPEPIVDKANGTYTVELEPNVEYTISADGVNDYFIPSNKITITETTIADIVFQEKDVYPVSVVTQGLSESAINSLKVTFTNLNEAGYVYSFEDINAISLRDGVYKIGALGLDSFPVDLSLTSNLSVAQSATSKSLTFVPVNYWPFDDKVIANGDQAYKGLLFTGNVANEIAKSHLTLKPDATVKVPVEPGERVIVKFYYTADFTFDGTQQTITNSQSTSAIETVSYNYTGDNSGYVTITAGAGAATTYITDIITNKVIDYASKLYVGVDKDFQTINGALEAVRQMQREAGQRVTILIDPGNYEEMLDVNTPKVTLKNAASTPSIALQNKGVDIDANAVRITSYYGHGYNYFSMTNQRWNADVLKVNKENGYISYENKGAGTTNNSFWNATVLVSANGFEAEDIIFENSYNQYISKKETEDVVQEWAVGGKGTRPTDLGNTSVQSRTFVERACAIALTNNTDKAILYKCRVIGRQDALYGGTNARFVMYKGVAMGAVDYIFGAMNAVFYKTDLSMNTSDGSSDQTYITAAQQSSGRGYLMYECNVTSAIPGTESASATRSKPGYYGRPWQATTSEVVFYKTNIETSDFPGSEGKSLIVPVAWQNTLGGESKMMYEYGTVEQSGENNTDARASWSTILANPVLTDGTDINTFNFTKGSDGWDPIPDLLARDGVVATHNTIPVTTVNVYAVGNQVVVENVKDRTYIQVFDLNGKLLKSMSTRQDTTFDGPGAGIWIVSVVAADGRKAVKLFTY